MKINVQRGKDLFHEFNMKSPSGSVPNIKGVNFNVVLERGDFVREYQRGTGLFVDYQTSTATWRVSKEELAELPGQTLYYTLYANYINGRVEVDRGVIRLV